MHHLATNVVKVLASWLIHKIRLVRIYGLEVFL